MEAFISWFIAATLVTLLVALVLLLIPISFISIVKLYKQNIAAVFISTYILLIGINILGAGIQYRGSWYEYVHGYNLIMAIGASGILIPYLIRKVFDKI